MELDGVEASGVGDQNTYARAAEPGVRSMDLTARQREILATLTDGHRRTDAPVTAEEIADELDRHPGTIHNHMQVLGTLGLVEGFTGPHGGYEPTDAAETALGGTEPSGGEALTLAHEFDRLDVTVDEISFRSVRHPSTCRALVRFSGARSSMTVGDPVVVGPTPGTGLVVAGEVLVYDDEAAEALLDVTAVEAPVEA
jgi:predicted transcriptional regulator